MFLTIFKSRSHVVAIGALAIASVAPLQAQRPDSTRRADTAQSRISLVPPITPRRAFFYSFLVPGYSQTVLGRNKAAATFLLVEAISIAMIRESGADVREARRFENDTIIVSYTDASGAFNVAKTPGRFGDNEVRSRRAHVEDWVAFLVANHLFAGADAFVAAHLWDLPARLSVRVLPRGETVFAASIKW